MAIGAGGTRSGAEAWKRNSRARETRERVIKFFLTACAYLSIFTTVGIVVVLFEETLRFFLEVSPVEFLTSTQWAPPQGEFGILPLVYGTLMATVIAIAVALPVGLLTAIYLSEYAPTSLAAVAQAGAGDPGRRADGSLRVLRPDVHHPVLQG